MKIARLPLAEVPGDAYARLAAGSLFASPGFLDLWRAKGGRPVVWTAELQGALAAALPGVEYGRGPFAQFASMPDGCYGGVLLDPAHESVRPSIARALFEALARRRYAKASVFDFRESAPIHPGFSVIWCETTLVDISAPQWMPPDLKLQSEIRKAEREGIEVERFEWERHHAGFLDLVAATARQHGAKPRYAAPFYRALADLAERDDRVAWRWCEHRGRPAGSHIYFVEGDTLQAWQKYFDRSLSFLKPNQFMQFATCRETARRGITRLNLGATPLGAEGLAYYKARWGGRRVAYPSCVRVEGLRRVAYRVWASFARPTVQVAEMHTEPVPRPDGEDPAPGR